MPGLPRKPPQHNFPPLELPDSIDPRWLMEWFEEGYRQLCQFISHYYRFADYLDAHPSDEFNSLD